MIDEFAAIAAGQVSRLLGRSRAAGLSVILAGQALADDLVLAGPATTDILTPGERDIEWWVPLPREQALVVVGRGLHLDRPDVEVIERAPCVNPAYGGLVAVRGCGRRSGRWRRWRTLRRALGSFATARR